MKIIVDEIPKTPKDCIFCEYSPILKKWSCAILSNTGARYTLCKLERGHDICPYLKGENN